MLDPGKVVILGAGPTGLGAGIRLQELGFQNFIIIERDDEVGGLARSYHDPQGFTWDLGGHVQFSHYTYYDQLLNNVLRAEWLWHMRESWVWLKKRFVPYPFQYNIHYLDQADRDRIVQGLKRVKSSEHTDPPNNFGEWISSTFGTALAGIFMIPYNFKAWGYPAELMEWNWVGERVALPDLERIKENIRLNRDDLSWGPNNKFRFPLQGGTGAIWKQVA